MGSPAMETYGPIFVGMAFNILLYGIMITQTFLYYNAYKRDKTWIKLFVALLFLCDSLNCAFDIAFTYIPLVNQFDNPAALNSATWLFGTDPALTAIIALLVQGFFAWRVKVLTGSTPLVIFIGLCSFVQCCGGLGTSIAVGILPEFIHFQRFKVIVIVWLAFSAVVDTTITIALVWHLRQHKTGFSKSDDVVNRIIRLTVQTGLITALCAVVDLILFLASPSGLHLIFNLPLSKLYTNSLMSSLNSRAGWKYGSGLASASQSASIDRSRSEGSRSLNLRNDANANWRIPQQVLIEVESHEMVDPLELKSSPVQKSPGGSSVDNNFSLHDKYDVKRPASWVPKGVA